MEQSLTEIIKYIKPSDLSYEEWLWIGMGLKEAGYSARDWEEWSKNDARFRFGECEKKWESFSGSSSPITAGTIIQMAKERGWRPFKNTENRALDWDDYIVVDPNWIEDTEVKRPNNWNPVKDIITYLETLFEAGENVGYVSESWQKEEGGKFIPKNKGCYDRTAGQLIEELDKCGGDIGAVFGDYNKSGGIWVRFNPLDGKGVKNDNVTDFRYALVESDEMDIEQQNAIIRELELPVACLVHSGGKSLHAIVKVDAVNYIDYKHRVDYLYNACKQNGLKIDSQNRNPSRLSRLPGVQRGNNKQWLVDTNIGKESWNEWREWIEAINDDLPDFENFKDVLDKMPELSPELIKGVLRQGHKMLLAGPSKAGKSFALIQLAIAIAEGGVWLETWECAQGKVLYINLELDNASCLYRFKDVYEKSAYHAMSNADNIHIWNLRGKSVSLDKLVPKLTRRAKKNKYIAVIIDPIYKVITGDENSADQMALFCNQFDKICSELNCAVIYCHHHSKSAAYNSNAVNRASGSGVFARDPDALLDMIELSKEDVSEEVLKNTDIGEEDTVWRMEGTLREFKSFKPFELKFSFPYHRRIQGFEKIGNKYGYVDKKTAGERANKKRAKEKLDNVEKLEQWVESTISFEPDREYVSVKEASEYFGVERQTIYRWLEKSDRLERNSGRISVINN